MKRILSLGLLLTCASSSLHAADSPVKFDARTVQSGRWSDAQTWADQRAPRAGDFVQVRTGHTVTYDVESADALRMVHVAGQLSFARDHNTALAVGLLKIAAGDETTEDGFECHDTPDLLPAERTGAVATLEIGTSEKPIPAAVQAKIRLVYFPSADANALPAIVNCGGRWEVHGAPLPRTWLKLGAPVKPGDNEVLLTESATGWKVGDHIIVTASKEGDRGSTYRQKVESRQTEERMISALEGPRLILEPPLEREHFGAGETRSEVANLSRNVIIESANPAGVRGHTMFHRGSTGGISYAEFRHLGKEGVLGKYAIHFHLVRDTMRGSGVIGASIWDSHNRWLTIHGTDYLLVRDCVGYQSVGHGFFLEDGTEQYNVFDRNLAVQAYRGKRLPKQILSFDANDGAGFWWANGRNTFVRNVACENDEYGFRFEIAKRSNFDPVLNLRGPDGTRAPRDVRTIPFFRFDHNESHSEGLYSFNFGDDENPSVHGDRQHPFIAQNLKAWETHYAVRPNIQFFLLDGLRVDHAAYGVYHPDYDAHVYRNIHLNRVDSEPINRGHDDESIQDGTFTYDGLTIENSKIGRDPLIQMACTSPRLDAAGHFRNLVLKNSSSREGKVVDLGGGPRNKKLDHPVSYFFHGYFAPNEVTRVMSANFPEPLTGSFQSIDGFTGKDVRAAGAGPIEFPQLLDAVDDLAPATLVTSVKRVERTLVVTGISHDNGEVASVRVNGVEAERGNSNFGVVDWTAMVDDPGDGAISAYAIDRGGNREQMVATAAVPNAQISPPIAAAR